MKRNVLKEKIKNNNGVSRLVFILIAIILVLIILVSIPIYIYYRKQSEKIGCTQGLDTATRQLYDAYLMGDIHSVADARKRITLVMNGWEDLCPAYGNIYIVESKDPAEKPYRLVCGLHCDDKKEKTRLNAENVFEQVKKRVKELRALGDKYPSAVTVKLNGKELTALLVTSPTDIKYGTSITDNVKGTVAYYGITGNFAFENTSGVPEGSVCYFNFADEDNGAVFCEPEGWWGSSYGYILDK